MIDKRNLGAGQASVVPSSIRLLMPNGHVTEMKLETYLAGVVAMEIGSNAPLEALKAQAVASRTYAAAAPRHVEKNADVCTTTHCQKWKRVDPIVAPEVFRAVSETWGVVALHEGKLIEAFFFEHCSGQTRNSTDMAMAELAYLRSVNCPCGFSDMRGHGVGLCQRGAIVLARNGASFEQILRHYYRGIAIVRTQREEQPRREQPVVKKGKEPRTKTSAPLGKPSQSKPAPVPRPSTQPAPMPNSPPRPAPVPGPSSQPAPVPSPSSQPTPVPSPSPQPAPESHEITTLIKMLRQTQATKQGAAPEKPAPPLGTSTSAEKASADASAIELEPKGFRADAPSISPAMLDGVRQETPMAPSVPDGVRQEMPTAPSVPEGVGQETPTPP